MHKANRLNSLHTKMINFTSKTLLFYKKNYNSRVGFFYKKKTDTTTKSSPIFADPQLYTRLLPQGRPALSPASRPGNSAACNPCRRSWIRAWRSRPRPPPNLPRRARPARSSPPTETIKKLLKILHNNTTF